MKKSWASSIKNYFAEQSSMVPQDHDFFYLNLEDFFDLEVQYLSGNFSKPIVSLVINYFVMQ